MKRLISLILCLTICLTLVPTKAVSADPNQMLGTGTPDDPYQIATAEHLLQFRDKVNKEGETSACAILVNDIVFNEGITYGYYGIQDMTNSDVESGKKPVVLINGEPLSENNIPKDQWIPISDPVISADDYLAIIDRKDVELVSGWYNGIFDGRGHTISGLFCDYQQEVTFSGMSSAALFTSLGEHGVVRNVGIVNSFFRGDAAASVVVANQGTVHGCYSDAIVVGYASPTEDEEGNEEEATEEGNEEEATEEALAGGICSITIKDKASIQRCFYTGKIEGPVYYDTAGRPSEFLFGGILATVGWNGYLGGAESNIRKNYYASDYSATHKGCTYRSLDSFFNGRVAYELNKGETFDQYNLEFRQNLDKGARETIPSYNANSGQIYQVTGCVDDEIIWSNSNADKPYHEYDTQGVCMNGCNQQAVMSYSIDGVTEYTRDPEEAFEAVRNKTAIITLLCDYKLSSTWTVAPGNVTLDLNGKTLHLEESIVVKDSGSVLVIRDQVGGGVISGYYAVSPILVSGGDLFVESGTIDASSGTEPAVHMTDGHVEISGGQFISADAEVSVKLLENSLVTGGKFTGMSCDVPISQILEVGYWAVNANGKELDTDVKILKGEFEVAPAGTKPTDPEKPVEDPKDPSGDSQGPSNDPQNPSVPEETVPEPTPGAPDVIWPDKPDVEVDNTPVVGEPVFQGIPGKCVDEIYLVLDVDPLLGLSREELFNSISVKGYEGYEKVCQIPDYDESIDKIRTSDRLKISYKEGDKVIQSRTFVIVILGDTNCDGMAMSNDAALMVKLASTSANETREVMLAADVNMDGKVKANDAQRLIYRYFNYSLDYETPMN